MCVEILPDNIHRIRLGVVIPSFFAAESGVVVDLGCNLGGVSHCAAAVGFDVVCVEILPDNIHRIRLGLAFNNATSRVRVVEAAVSDTDGAVVAMHEGSTVFFALSIVGDFGFPVLSRVL